MRHKTLVISITAVLCLLGGYSYLSNRPLYLASSPELIPAFFSLPEDEIVWGKGFVKVILKDANLKISAHRIML